MMVIKPSSPVSRHQWWVNIVTNPDFALQQASTLKGECSQHDGVFIEFPVLNKQTKDMENEYTVIPTDKFKRRKKSNGSEFASHFTEKEDENFIVFSSINNDGVLVCPNRLKSEDEDHLKYSHLGAFCKYSTIETLAQLLEIIGKQVLSIFESGRFENIYVSTSGLAIPWLHFRIYDSPKYYQNVEYTR
jgi:hypothetical protein